MIIDTITRWEFTATYNYNPEFNLPPYAETWWVDTCENGWCIKSQKSIEPSFGGTVVSTFLDDTYLGNVRAFSAAVRCLEAAKKSFARGGWEITND